MNGAEAVAPILRREGIEHLNPISDALAAFGVSLRSPTTFASLIDPPVAAGIATV